MYCKYFKGKRLQIIAGLFYCKMQIVCTGGVNDEPDLKSPLHVEHVNCDSADDVGMMRVMAIWKR